MEQAPRPSVRFRVVVGIVRTLLLRMLRWDLRVEGVEHVPERGGCVLVWNHHSEVDYVPLAVAVLDGRDRAVRFLAKRSLWASPRTRWMVELAGAVPVDRGSDAARARALDDAMAALRHGEVVGVAPEGTISDSFELLPFRLGAVRMAQEAGVPIVPSVGWGSHRAFPRGRRPRARFGQPVVVRFGPPLTIGVGDDLHAANERLRAVMARMLAEVQAQYPVAPEPGDDWWQPQALGGSAPNHDDVLARHRERTARWQDHDRE